MTRIAMTRPIFGVGSSGFFIQFKIPRIGRRRMNFHDQLKTARKKVSQLPSQQQSDEFIAAECKYIIYNKGQLNRLLLCRDLEALKSRNAKHFHIP